MTIQDLLDQGVEIESYCKITSYDYETNSIVIHYQGENPRSAPEECLNRNIKYIYASSESLRGPYRPGCAIATCLIIEIEDDEEY